MTGSNDQKEALRVLVAALGKYTVAASLDKDARTIESWLKPGVRLKVVNLSLDGFTENINVNVTDAYRRYLQVGYWEWALGSGAAHGRGWFLPNLVGTFDEAPIMNRNEVAVTVTLQILELATAFAVAVGGHTGMDTNEYLRKVHQRRLGPPRLTANSMVTRWGIKSTASVRRPRHSRWAPTGRASQSVPDRLDHQAQRVSLVTERRSDEILESCSRCNHINDTCIDELELLRVHLGKNSEVSFAGLGPEPDGTAVAHLGVVDRPPRMPNDRDVDPAKAKAPLDEPQVLAIDNDPRKLHLTAGAVELVVLVNGASGDVYRPAN